MENINQIRQLTLRVKEYLVSLSTDPPETILDIESIERHVDRLALLVSVDEEEEEESEEEDYKAFGVMGENSDCEDDLGFFDSMVAATVCFEDAVKDGEYDHVFIFDTDGYNGEQNRHAVSIIREFKKETDEEEETDESDEPVEEPEQVKKLTGITLTGVRYKYNEATMAVYITHKDDDGKDDTAKRQSLGTLADKKIKFTDHGNLQHQLARTFVDKVWFVSTAEHPDDQDLNLYKMSYDCNDDVPIIGESFNINMGGVTYEVTGEEFGQGKYGFVVKHNGVVLPGLLFDYNPTSKTVLQLVGLKDNSKQFRSAHVARVKKLTSPKKNRTARQPRLSSPRSLREAQP